MDVLDEEPVTHLSTLGNLLLDFLLNAFWDSKGVKFYWICRVQWHLERLKLFVNVDRVCNKEQDWSVLGRLFVCFFDQQLIIAISVFLRGHFEAFGTFFRIAHLWLDLWAEISATGERLRAFHSQCPFNINKSGEDVHAEICIVEVIDGTDDVMKTGLNQVGSYAP